MEKLKYIYSLLIFLIFVGFSYAQDSTKQSVVDTLVNNFVIVDPGSDETEVVKKLGPPIRKKIEEIENPGSNIKDEIIYYFYPDLEIVFYHFKHPTRGWKRICRIVFESNDYELKYGIKIGMHVSEIFNRFGNNYQQLFEDNGLKYIVYQTPLSVHDQVLFVLKEDKLEKLIFSNWP